MAKDDLINDLAGVDDDDLTLDKNDVGDDGEDDTEASLEEIIAGLTTGEDEESDDEEESDDNPDDDSNVDEPDEDTKFNERLTQELNRIIPQRLARDRKTQQVQELEALTGLTIDQIKAQVIQNAVLDTADKMGISEEEAREVVNQKFENTSLKAEKVTKAQEEAEISAAMQQVNYIKEKTDHTRQPKLARVLTPDVVKEIDNFTQNGTLLSFKDGMQYVLGAKLANGELLNKMQTGAENKAKKTAASGGGKATPKGGGGSSKSDSAGSLTRQERMVAANLGLTDKEYAAEKIKEQNSKRRKGR